MSKKNTASKKVNAVGQEPSSPTKSQRHEAYKMALKLFDECPGALCHIIGDIAKEKGLRRPLIWMEEWPEFLAQKPEKADQHCYWWSGSSKSAQRRSALVKMIAASAPTKRIAPTRDSDRSGKPAAKRGLVAKSAGRKASPKPSKT